MAEKYFLGKKKYRPLGSSDKQIVKYPESLWPVPLVKAEKESAESPSCLVLCTSSPWIITVPKLPANNPFKSQYFRVKKNRSFRLSKFKYKF